MLCITRLHNGERVVVLAPWLFVQHEVHVAVGGVVVGVDQRGSLVRKVGSPHKDAQAEAVGNGLHHGVVGPLPISSHSAEPLLEAVDHQHRIIPISAQRNMPYCQATKFSMVVFSLRHLRSDGTKETIAVAQSVNPETSCHWLKSSGRDWEEWTRPV